MAPGHSARRPPAPVGVADLPADSGVAHGQTLAAIAKLMLREDFDESGWLERQARPSSEAAPGVAISTAASGPVAL